MGVEMRPMEFDGVHLSIPSAPPSRLPNFVHLRRMLSSEVLYAD